MSRRLRNSLTAFILLFGLTAAAWVYFTAEPDDVDPYDSLAQKKYVHELSVYGGKANVVTAEFIQWFGTLWHGRRLAGTILVLTGITVWAFRFSRHLVEEPPSAGPK